MAYSSPLSLLTGLGFFFLRSRWRPHAYGDDHRADERRLDELCGQAGDLPRLQDSPQAECAQYILTFVL